MLSLITTITDSEPTDSRSKREPVTSCLERVCNAVAEGASPDYQPSMSDQEPGGASRALPHREAKFYRSSSKRRALPALSLLAVASAD